MNRDNMMECKRCQGSGSLCFQDSEAQVYANCPDCNATGYVPTDEQTQRINEFTNTVRARYLEAKVRREAEDTRKKAQAEAAKRAKESHTRDVVGRLLMHWGIQPVDDLIEIRYGTATVNIWDGFTIEIETVPDGADMQGETVWIGLGHSIEDYENAPTLLDCHLTTALGLGADRFWEIFAEKFPPFEADVRHAEWKRNSEQANG